jgi:hypothetical protein
MRQEANDMEPDCVQVARGDDPFTARMRFHQSWYRRHVLHLPPGPNPSAKGKLYGSQITEADGLAGRNFITDRIHAAVERRISDGHGLVEPKRARCNLLSSQPMCFNLWAPLADDTTLATRLVRVLPGLPEDLCVTRVILEHAPDKKSHLDDATAFDAFVEYKLPSSAHGFVGIETKLTEPFSQKAYEFRRRYNRWKEEGDWWWQTGAEAQFLDPRINQLWRNHLLAFAMLHQSPAEYAEGYCAVLYHDGDGTCAEAITVYRGHLRPHAGGTLLAWPLSDLVTAWEAAAKSLDEKRWLAALRLRYLALSASEAAWATHNTRK